MFLILEAGYSTIAGGASFCTCLTLFVCDVGCTWQAFVASYSWLSRTSLRYVCYKKLVFSFSIYRAMAMSVVY